MAKESDGKSSEAERTSLVNQINEAIHGRPELRSLALTGLFVIAMFVVLYLGRSVFIPVAFAVMLSFVFRPVVRGLRKLGLPAAVGATLVLVALTGGIAFGVVQLAEPATEWVARMPTALRSVEHKVIRLRRPVESVTKLANRVEKIAKVDKSKPVREVTVEQPGLFESAVTKARELVSGAVVMLITLYFMLIWGDKLIERLMAFVPDLQGNKRTTGVMNDIEKRMSQYMRTVVLINAVLGVSVGGVMYLLKMPNPVLWGALAFVVNFVPYLGSLAGVLVVALASLLTFNDVSQALLPPAAYLALTALEGNVVSPIVMGRAFRVSPLVIFLWLVLWAWLWGLAGAILAVPLLMLLKIASDQSKGLAPISTLLQR